MLFRVLSNLLANRRLARSAMHCDKLVQQGSLHDAARCYEESVATVGAVALYRAGMLYMQMGEQEKAGLLFQRACEMEPGNINFLAGKANLACLQKNYDKAIQIYQQLLTTQPDNPAILSNLARALRKNARYHDAEMVLRQARKVDDSAPQTVLDLGRVLLAQDKIEEAIECFTQLTHLPEYATDAYYNLALTNRQLGEYVLARGDIHKVLEMEPDNLRARCMLARLYADSRNYGLAEKEYSELLRLEPDNEDVVKGMSELQLLLGNFKEGWRGYEKRLNRPDNMMALAGHDLCKEPGAGNAIVIIGEQGIGDEIMFASCIPDVLQQNKNCALICAPRLVRLFARSFPELQVFARDAKDTPQLTDFECYLPMGSLPRFYRNSIEDFPDHASYLVADSQRTVYWRDLLEKSGNGLKVGVSWRGGTVTTRSRLRSIDLMEWAPILQKSGCVFVDLQYGDHARERQNVESMLGIKLHHWEHALQDLDETAALVNALDVVISACTSLVSLTGALGRPALVMVPYSPGWIFTSQGASMPWFPSLK
jgi:tetratricopeptide (TPR) repeat protein